MPRNWLRMSLESGEFCYSAELVLGRDHSALEAGAFVKQAANHPRGVKIISLTDLPSGKPALPPDAFVDYVIEHGLSPLAHFTGRDGNRRLLEARLHALSRFGSNKPCGGEQNIASEDARK